MIYKNFALFLLVLCIFNFAFVEARIFCYRRLKRSNKCGGYLRRSERYTTPEKCCKRGQGFALKKVKLGKNRFKCTPCLSLLEESQEHHLQNYKPTTTTTTTRRTTTTTTSPRTMSTTNTPSTTQFYWPTPMRRDYYVVANYPPPKDKDGNVIVWEEWSPCSVSCGAGWRSRSKVCENCDKNDYDNVQSQPCMDNFYCPVDGNWGPWFPWNSCSISCNGGTRERKRKCNYPPPAYGGRICAGEAMAAQECNNTPCPIDGGWGEWAAPSACSKSCGLGYTRRTRRCDNPLPQFGGNDCEGAESYTRRCETKVCPVDGQWSLWGSWSLCSSTCGQGTKRRTRPCDNPEPKHGGDICEGRGHEAKTCYGERPCPIDGGWSEWTNYGYCRAPRCGHGEQIRSRSCSKPRPAHGGRPCRGEQYERVHCFNDYKCPVNGSWCSWTDWNACSTSCAEDGAVQGRQRQCACPSPSNGGLDCQGKEFEIRECQNVTNCFQTGKQLQEKEDEVTNENIDRIEVSTMMLTTNGKTTKLSEEEERTQDPLKQEIKTSTQNTVEKPRSTVKNMDKEKSTEATIAKLNSVSIKFSVKSNKNN